MALIGCVSDPVGRRKRFWSTQVCGATPDECGSECSTFGLKMLPEDCGVGCDNTKIAGCVEDITRSPRQIATTDWVRGLAINILMTDGRNPDSKCGYPPGRRGGHWSESYASGNGGITPLKVGSLLRALPRIGSIAASTQAIKIQAEIDLNKLVTYGVATSVDVTVSYTGGNRYSLNAVIYGIDGATSNVGLSGSRLENAFVWAA